MKPGCLTAAGFFLYQALVNVLESLSPGPGRNTPRPVRSGLASQVFPPDPVPGGVLLAVATADLLERLAALSSPVCFLDSPAPVIAENRVFFLRSL